MALSPSGDTELIGYFEQLNRQNEIPRFHFKKEKPLPPGKKIFQWAVVFL